MEIPEDLKMEAEELKAEYKNLKASEELIKTSYAKWCEKVKKLAKFKEGDRVTWQSTDFTNNRKIPGIVREVIVGNSRCYFPYASISDGAKVEIVYCVARITSKGIAHKIHNIRYAPIKESELEATDEKNN